MDSIKFKDVLDTVKEFFRGASDYKRKSRSLLVKESHNEMDEFLLLCFGDLLGIPIPTSYYSLELLPLLADELEGWNFRMTCRKDIWKEKWGDYGFDA